MIELVKSSFYHEAETKQKLADFILEANILSMNKYCATFERMFAEKQGRKFAVYVNSGSMANLVLIQAMLNIGTLKAGDRVGVSSLTWATNIMPLIQLGLKPVLIDCEVGTLNVSPATLRGVQTTIDALFITNVLGLCDDLASIRDICKEEGIVLIEDNCESLGSQTAGTLLGNFGLASTFSFFVGHHISTIEGGMICTDDEALYHMLVMVRAHGWDRNLPSVTQQALRKESHSSDFYAKYLFYDLAFNARPTEINGFLGTIQITYWDEIVSRREANYMRFLAAVKQNPDFIPVENANMDRVSSFALPIVCRTEELCEHYKTVFSGAADTRPIIAGDMSKQPFYQKHVEVAAPCENSEFVHTNGFYIGNNPELTEEDLVLIETTLKS